MKFTQLIVLALMAVLLLTACQQAQPDSAPTTHPATRPTTQPTTTFTEPTTEPIVPTTQPTIPTTQPHTHNFKASVTKTPTCEEAGEKTFVCACGEQYIEPIDPTGHEYSSAVTKETSCAAQGEITFTCKCGDSYIQYIDKLEHTWGYWTSIREATLTVPGEMQRTCNICSAIETQEEEVYTLDEALSMMARCARFLPEFQSPDELYGGALLEWVISRVNPVSDTWDEENCQIITVYSLDDIDALTMLYFGRTYDFLYLVEYNDDMSYDAQTNTLTILSYGSGGWDRYEFDSYTQEDDTHFIVRYVCLDIETDEPREYGLIELVIVDGWFQILSHTIE